MTDMTTFTITRGLPGSGKTTWAKSQDGRRVNRDELRLMLHGGWAQTRAILGGEDEISAVQFAAARALLEYGVPVIVDDTSLRTETVVRWWNLARVLDVKMEIRDFTGVPLGVCLERDVRRTAYVGADVITGMVKRYFPLKALPARLLDTVAVHDMSNWVPEEV